MHLISYLCNLKAELYVLTPLSEPQTNNQLSYNGYTLLYVHVLVTIRK